MTHEPTEIVLYVRSLTPDGVSHRTGDIYDYRHFIDHSAPGFLHKEVKRLSELFAAQVEDYYKDK